MWFDKLLSNNEAKFSAVDIVYSTVVTVNRQPLCLTVTNVYNYVVFQVTYCSFVLLHYIISIICSISTLLKWINYLCLGFTTNIASCSIRSRYIKRLLSKTIITLGAVTENSLQPTFFSIQLSVYIFKI